MYFPEDRAIFGCTIGGIIESVFRKAKSIGGLVAREPSQKAKNAMKCTRRQHLLSIPS